jgi:transcriptional regulator with XRE-family HTH domain
MNIIISENLKELRKQKKNTQEDIAKFLAVSITAVSKWERGECYPDIELLPKIASYYDISVDDLLGVGEIKKKERIDEYMRKKIHFSHIGDVKSELEVLREAQKEFPNDWGILCALMYSLSRNNDKKEIELIYEIIEIGNKILEKCTDNKTRYGAIQVLCFLHKDIKDKEKAKEYANMAPSYYVTSDELLSHVLEGDELIEHCQHKIISLTELLGQEVFIYGWYKGGLKGDEKKRAYQTALKIYELIYDNDDFGFYACRLSQIYGCLADAAAEEQNKDETIKYLDNEVKYAILYDTQGDYKHTSFLVNRKSHESKLSTKNYKSNVSYTVLKGLENKRYDFCRDDEIFIKLVSDLEKIAKEDASK